MPIPPLLDELLRAPGPTGREDAVSAIVRREAAALGADIETDVLGSTIARITGTDGSRVLAFVAHVDQVSVAVSHVFDDGLVGVCKLANWDAVSARGQRFAILTTAGVVPAVCVRVGTGDVTWEQLRLDVGADGREGALALVRIGDPAVPVALPTELAAHRIASAALDDRAGVYAAIEALRRLAADPPAWDVALVATTQEEGQAFGSRAVADRLRPDAAVVVEVTYATDASGPDPVEWGSHDLGDGPAIFRGPVVSPIVTDGLLAVAASEGVAFSVETGRFTSSDTDEIVGVAGGIPSGMVSIPLRSMHTANEVVDLADVDATSRLLEAYARSLEPDVSFLR
jgi:putative aminopeptidase FrvX